MPISDLSQVSEVNVLRAKGADLKVGTPTSVEVLEVDESNNVLFARGATVPTNGDSGFAVGSYFIDTTGGVGVTVYINEGSATSADFNALGVGGGGGSGSLDTAYDIGRDITVDSGAITLTDATSGAGGMLVLTKTGAGSGDLLHFDVDAAMTGNAISLDMNLGTAATGIFIDNGAGARTGADILVTGDSTGTHSVIDINASGSGALTAFDYTGSYNGSPAGTVFSVTFDASDNLDTTVMLLTTGSGNRDVMFNFDLGHTDSGTSSHIFDIDFSGVFDSNVFDVAFAAASTGNVCNFVMDNAVAATAIRITGAGVRTQPFIELIGTQTGSANMIDLSADGAFTGHVVDIDMTTAVGGSAITLTGAGSRTEDLIQINDSSTGSAHIFDINLSGAYTGNVLDVASSAAATGNVINIDLDAGLALTAIRLDAGGGLRTQPVFEMILDGTGTSAGAVGFDIDVSATGATASGVFDIDVSGVYTGSVFDINMSGAATGDIFLITTDAAVDAKVMRITSTGARVDDLFEVNDSSTSNSHVFDINVSGNSTGNVLDIVYSSSAVTGDAIHVDMGTNLAGNALQIDAAGVRTAPLIYIANTGTDGGTDDHVLFINQTGLQDSNLIQLTFATAASTGEALSIAMDTNVAGRAIAITSAGTGVSGEGCSIDVTHTGDLVAGANLVDIISTGSPSSTSHTVSIQQTTGAGTAGAYALYINATGANVEALKVDAGAVVFDEVLTVTGLATLTAGIDAKVIFAGTETIAAGGTSTALSLSKTVHYVDADAGGDTFTLADGTEGQIMTIAMASSTGTATITPTNLRGGTSVTFNAAGDSVVLQFIASEWNILGGNSYGVS